MIGHDIVSNIINNIPSIVTHNPNIIHVANITTPTAGETTEKETRVDKFAYDVDDEWVLVRVLHRLLVQHAVVNALAQIIGTPSFSQTRRMLPSSV